MRVCRTLEDLGITHVFGVPGSQTVSLYEALRRSSLTSIVPSSELSAAFMAGAFYRASGRPAVLSTIPGPGFTLALTGLAEARLDSAALLHLTIAAPDGVDARFGLQAIPQHDLGRPLAKATFQVDRVEDIESALQAAYRLSLSGEPGPVIIALTDATAGTLAPIPHWPLMSPDLADSAVAETWERLAAARRPLIYAGQGAIGCASQIQELAEVLHAPVMTTPSGRGLLHETHDLSMPFDPCRGGLEAARALMDRSDLVVVLGAKLGHNGSAGRSLAFLADRSIQIDAGPDIAGEAYGIPSVTCRVEDWFAAKPVQGLQPSDWTSAELQRARDKLRSPADRPVEPHVAGGTAEAFFGRLRNAVAAETIVVTDTGLHQVLARRHFDVLTPRGLLLPSDFQSMGFGLPAAIAARLACPDRPVVAVVGDGSLAMNGFELATLADLHLQLPVIVFSDGFLNQIRYQQLVDFGLASGTRLPSLDWQAFAKSVGIEYLYCAQVDTTTFPGILSMDQPVLVEVPVGDSHALRQVRMRSRARGLIRRMLGPELTARLQRLMRHT